MTRESEAEWRSSVLLKQDSVGHNWRACKTKQLRHVDTYTDRATHVIGSLRRVVVFHAIIKTLGDSRTRRSAGGLGGGR